MDWVCDFKIIYIYMNSYVDFNLKNIIKLKMTTLLYSLGHYMVLILKNRYI
jgi:hypothetical protein